MPKFSQHKLPHPIRKFPQLVRIGWGIFLALDLIVDTMRSVSILHLLLANSATLAFSRGNDRSNFFKQFRGVDHYQSKFLTYSCNTLIEEIWV